MASNFQSATIQPNFPEAVVIKHHEELTHLGVNYDGGYLYVEDGCEDWDDLHKVLQEMLKEENMEYCYVQGAEWCSSMRPDEFDGFAHFITPNSVDFFSTFEWLEFKKKKFTNTDETKKFMDIGQAFEIVLQLAQDNIDEEDDIDVGVKEARKIALDTVTDFVVNHFGRSEE